MQNETKTSFLLQLSTFFQRKFKNYKINTLLKFLVFHAISVCLKCFQMKVG